MIDLSLGAKRLGGNGGGVAGRRRMRIGSTCSRPTDRADPGRFEVRTVALGAGQLHLQICGVVALITEMWRTLPPEPYGNDNPELVDSDGVPTSTVNEPPGRANGPGS